MVFDDNEEQRELLHRRYRNFAQRWLNCEDREVHQLGDR